MRNFFLLFAVLALLVISAPSVQAQWQCLYATYDATLNGTGHQTASVGVISENMFVALVMTPNTRNFMIPYVNADSSRGRVNFLGYGGPATSGKYQVWSDGGFDQVELRNAGKLIARPDSLIYVANNDAEHNILVFKFTGDTVKATSPFRRQPTGSKGILGLAVDNSGYVYVVNDTSNGVTDDIKIYKPVGQWNDLHTDLPLRTIDLPDGIYKGITVNPDGKFLFVSDYGNRKILKYVGSPTTGYTLDQNFNFSLTSVDTIAGATSRPSLIGLAYRTPNNILFAASDIWLGGGIAYSWGRIYLINPNTGALASSDSSVSVIDVAKWNFEKTGGYNLRSGGIDPSNASGYTSTYDVAFDQNGNLYSQSHYGWTVEKWRYTGTLPTIVTSVERVEVDIPEDFRLYQNYPNPFNPSTMITFAVHAAENVSLKVTDLLGRQVATLVDEHLTPGSYRVVFDAQDLPGGTYFYTLRTGETSATKKMILLK